MKIAVVILSYNNKTDTIDCLRSLSEVSSATDLSVIVVDNGSKEKFKLGNESIKLTDKFFDIKVIRNDKNLGFSGGNNIGIRYAQSLGVDYTLILNNDTIVEKKIIEELYSVAKSNDDAGIIVPKIYFAKGYEFHKDRYKNDERGKVIWYAGGIVDWKNVLTSHRGVDEVDHGQYEVSSTTEFATGCCMLVKEKVFEKVGLFDERYFLYYEDGDFSERVKRSGYRILYQPKAILWHKNAATAGGAGSTLQDYYISRNRLIFAMKFASFRSKLALIKETFQLLLSGRKWQKRGIIDFYVGKWGRGSYPLPKNALMI